MPHPHLFKQIFDIDKASSSVRRKHPHCYITDSPTLKELVRSKNISLSASFYRIKPKLEGFRRRYYIPFVKVGDPIHSVYAGLALSPRLRELLVQCESKVIETLGDYKYITLHARVEDDWLAYCRRDFRNDKTCYVDGKQIADKVVSSQHTRDIKNVLILYASARLNNRKSVSQFGQQPDPKHSWPGDWKVTTLQDLQCFNHILHGRKLTYFEQSALSFFLAAGTTEDVQFVGSSRSTFANSVSLVRQLLHPHSQPRSFYYNCASQSGQLVLANSGNGYSTKPKPKC